MGQRHKAIAKIKLLRERLDIVATIIVALGTIGGAVLTAGNWIISEVSAQSNERIDRLQDEMQQHQNESSLAIMRLELMNLIQNDPDNEVEIEILGKKYFQSGGNSYMSGIYSKYAKEHGLDTSFIVNK